MPHHHNGTYHPSIWTDWHTLTVVTTTSGVFSGLFARQAWKRLCSCITAISRPLFRLSSDTGYLFVESSSLPLKSRPLRLWSLTAIALVIIPRPCPRAGKRIRFLPFLSEFFVSVSYGSSFCSTNRTQNVLEFILEATTTTPPFAHARPTQRQVFFVTFSPTCIFSLHH